MQLVLSLAQKLIESLKNDHFDNWDEFRFGPEKKITQQSWFLSKVKFLNSHGYVHGEQTKTLFGLIHSILGPYLKDLQNCYNLLADETSQQTYVEVLAYRILGHRKVKLSSNNSHLDSFKNKVRKGINYSDSISSNFGDRLLYRHNWVYKGMPISMYLSEQGPLNAFYLKQYYCKSENPGNIAPEKNDVVIDCGGCWGDTTLEFAASVGEQGKVYVYEFIPLNKNILEKNIDLNPILGDRIELLNNAVWEHSEIDIYYKDEGPGSRVQFEKFDTQEGISKTLSIDDLVKLKNMNKVDFIKMDIEGSELPALKGAINTLKRFRPKLAISIYHSMEDYAYIVPWIRSLGIAYKFFVRHFTIHAEETILFVISK